MTMMLLRLGRDHMDRGRGLEMGLEMGLGWGLEGQRHITQTQRDDGR